MKASGSHSLASRVGWPRRGWRFLIGVCVVACLSLSCQSAPAPPPQVAQGPAAAQAAVAAPPPLLRATIAHAGVTPNVAPVWLAADLEFGREYGLDLVVQQTR